MSSFKRESRYIVIKRSDLDESQQEALTDTMQSYHINQRAGVVVEHNWPEFEAVWDLIEKRVTGDKK